MQVGLGVVGAKFDGPRMAGDSIGNAVLLGQRHAEVDMGLGQLRIDVDGPTKTGGRVRGLSHFLVNVAHVVVGIGVRRVDFQRRFVAGDRLFPTLEGGVN